jgi:hypothetical protein
MIITAFEKGVRIGAVEVLSTDRGARSTLCDLIGPVDKITGGGPRGAYRRVYWLTSGIVVVAEEASDELVMMYVCFDSNESPYPDDSSQVSTFAGIVVVDNLTIRGGETEANFNGIEGLSGFTPMMSLRRGDLTVGLFLRKPRGATGKRYGTRKLVLLSLEWGGPKPFPPRARPKPVN